MDLFDYNRERQIRKEQPLAARLRPRTLDEFIGQEHILAPGRLLRRAIQADQLSSLLFYGPPGTGKTTLASVIANTTKSHFVTLNAVLAGVQDLRRITQEAQDRRGQQGRRTILFIDEVHRWNKAQQDALLPWVENGTVILIGATTENPYFTVNRALVSRSRIFQLKPLTTAHLQAVLRQALRDPERGYGKLRVELHPDALAHLADVANGDARAALNALELAVETTPPDAAGTIAIDMAVAEESIQRRAVLYDKEGDYHFDTISAFIKSLRGSDPDAALYWLAKMVYAGEDPRFIFRRMLIFAGEDIGLADPNALVIANAAAEAFDRVGLPEGNYPLALCCLYLATAPKSNSVMGFFDALAIVEKEKEGEVPCHLRDASRDKEGFGHGAGYQYPHAYRDHWVAQQYLPDSLQGKLFYTPGRLGHEQALAETVRQRRELQLAALRESEGRLAPPEILTFSPTDKATDRWLARTLNGLGAEFATLRERVFAVRTPQRHELILDLSGDTALFTWEALRRAPEGGVWALASTPEAARALADQAQTLPEPRQPQILVGTPCGLRNLLAARGDGDVRFDLAVGRNLLARAADRPALLRELRALLAPGGTLSLAENLPRHGQRLTALLERGTGIPACEERGTGIPACEERGTGIPACKERSTGIHACEERGTGIPACEERGTGIPACEERGTGIPACEERGTGIPACEERGTGIPACEERGTGIPACKERSTGIPACEERGTDIPACAKPEAGIPACNPISPQDTILKTRRKLPHWQRANSVYFVTFRLADSLPQEKLDGWRRRRDAWLALHPEPWDDAAWEEYHRQFTEPMERWLDQGIGGCQLAAEEIRAELMTCLHRFDGERHHLHAYVVMPNHVHLLIEPTAGDTLATLLKGIKGASAKLINARLGRTGAFWQDESHDHIVRSEAQYEHYRAYIRGNPGKAKLAAGRYALYDAFAQTKMSAPRFSQTGMSVLPSGMPVSRWAAAEEFIYTDPADPLVNWDEATLATELAAAGFCEVRSDRALATHPRRIPPAQLDRWFADTPGSYARRLLAAGLDADDLRQFRAALTAAVAGREVPWTTTTLFLHATAP